MVKKKTAETAEKPYRNSDKISVVRGGRTIGWMRKYGRNKK